MVWNVSSILVCVLFNVLFPTVCRIEFRYHAVLMRARFDEHKDEKDMKLAFKLLEAGEKEFWERQHPQPYICEHFQAYSIYIL